MKPGGLDSSTKPRLTAGKTALPAPFLAPGVALRVGSGERAAPIFGCRASLAYAAVYMHVTQSLQGARISITLIQECTRGS